MWRHCWIFMNVKPIIVFEENPITQCDLARAFQPFNISTDWILNEAATYSYICTLVRCTFKWRVAVFRWHLTMFRFCVFMSSGCLVCLMCVVALRHFYCIVLADISRRLLASHETVPNDKKAVALDDRRRATLLDLLLTFKFLAIITCSRWNSWGENDFRSQIQQKNLMCA